MNKKHLDDFIKRADCLNIPVGELVSKYNHLAVSYSKNDFRPSEDNYNLAFETITKMKCYQIGDKK